MKLEKLFLISSVIFLTSTTHAVNYYMSPTGNDANSGKSVTSPWKTLDRLQKAQSIINPGDTIYFRGGNYIINDTATNVDYAKMYVWKGGTKSARITYRNYIRPDGVAEKPVILYDKRKIDVNKGHSTLLMPGSYATLDGLTFRQTEVSRCLALANGCQTRKSNYYRVHVQAVYLTTQLKDPSKALEKNVILRNCVVDNFSASGFSDKGSNNLVERNVFKNNANHVFYLQGPYNEYRYNLLDGSRQINETSHPSEAFGNAGRFGIQIQYVNTHHNKIYGNIIQNTDSAGVLFSGKVSYNEAYNNILINTGRIKGTMVGTWTQDGPVGVGNRFYNNTVIGKTQLGIFGGKLAEFPKIDIRDNIFNPSTTKPIGFSGSNLQNNIFYNVTGTIPAGNKKVNPLLVNPLGTTAASSALRTGSPAINAGLSSNYPRTDFYGRARPASYDIGAIEYGTATTSLAAPTNLRVSD